MFTKTRIAPTPSGFLHLGNVLSFAITAAIAHQHGAKILLRIDDLDRERVDPRYVQDIFDTLHFMDIPWHEGPTDYASYEKEYSQVHRMDMYQQALTQLKETENVFACTCSRAQIAAISREGAYPGACRDKGIPLDREQVNWRLRTDQTGDIPITTVNAGIVQASLPPEMQYFVVRKKDGFPAYQLTSILDDTYFGIDLVVRGEDLWPSTIAQCYLSGLLPGNTFRQTVSYHHPLLKETDDKKLSKSAGATSIQFLRKEGKSRTDIYTMIARELGHLMPVSDYLSLAALLPLPEYKGQ
ncbi:tRNA glutamyl-Q synthetase [Chitinophaga agrisoli]|uniref:tRNA glutamyl-Q synthetase n=1 Tax=Chitinophaga agrisoli TaxID=2607653 RepID=A0A5B2VPS9_9BACT|nr:glutamate--tRNA ligase family protein [Chitinophaga agrisoli]KAA2240302.1 tRNA glutamyl-Q synthetase [Chitinophaga agrisoli]